MRLQILSAALLSAATRVVANEVVSLYLPDWDDSVPFNAQVLGNEGSTTTYELACATKNDDCPFTETPITIVEGPSTLMYAYAEYSATANCSWGNNKNASCAVALVGPDSSTYSSTFYDPVTSYGVTITATATGGPQSNSASATPKATGSSSSSPTGSSASATGSSTSASSTSTPTDNAAMSQVTGRAPWVAGGAALLALAMV
ncbi:hypothetical protein BBP40_006170 [Aspergillus hancockii]|nr:hypothetical protein BBP40_006170 [Aspergillus hancockii]